MKESPLFVKLFEFLKWLLPVVAQFPRLYRFTLAERVQRQALDVQELLVAAGLNAGPSRAALLAQADVRLTQLRHTLRLCQALAVLETRHYEHAAEHLSELGKLLGAWRKQHPLSH